MVSFRLAGSRLGVGTVGIPANPCATARSRICRHIRYYPTSSDDLSQRWFSHVPIYITSALAYRNVGWSHVCRTYIRATAVTVAIMRLKAPAMLMLLPLLMSTICFFVAGLPENCYTSCHGGRGSRRFSHRWGTPAWVADALAEVGLTAPLPTARRETFPRAVHIAGVVRCGRGCLCDPLVEWDREGALLRRPPGGSLCEIAFSWGIELRCDDRNRVHNYIIIVRLRLRRFGDTRVKRNQCNSLCLVRECVLCACTCAFHPGPHPWIVI